MSISEAIALIASFGALLGTGAGVYIAWRKTPAEKRQLDSGAAEKWEGIASRSAQRIATLEKRVDELEATIETIQRADGEQIAQLEIERDELKSWAERLVHQVQSLGGQPVALRPVRGNGD